MDKTTNYVGQPIFSQLLSLIDDCSIVSAFKEHQAEVCTSIREVQADL